MINLWKVPFSRHLARKFWPDPADCYAHLLHRGVKGWLDPIDVRAIRALGRIQEEREVRGSVGEIGVHHGKLFLLLQLMGRPGETSFAIDIFEDQHLNPGQSGRGDLAVFRRNLSRYGNPTRNLHVLQRSSSEVTPAEITELCGEVRLFSIDGGHTADLTLNDLRLADSCLHEDGIVLVDDFFNPAWPQVSQGSYEYFGTAIARLVPFAIGPCKVYLSTRPNSAGYAEALAAHLGEDLTLKTTEMLGGRVVVLGKHGWVEHLRRTRLWKAVRDTAPVRPLRPLLRKLFG